MFTLYKPELDQIEYRWHDMTEPPPVQCWCHIIYQSRNGKTVYSNDLYAVESAIKNGHETGFCKNRFGQTVLAWHPYPVPWRPNMPQHLNPGWRMTDKQLPNTEAWYHITFRDKKLDYYYAKCDLFAIEKARQLGFEPGFTKRDQWPERDEIIAWLPYPEPPECYQNRKDVSHA